MKNTAKAQSRHVRGQKNLPPRAREKTSLLKKSQENPLENIVGGNRADGELRNSEELFTKIFDNGPLGMAMSDNRYHFVRANTVFCKMLGYTEQEIKDLSFKDITHPEDLGDSIEKVHELEKGKISVYKTEKRYITKNRDILWGSLTLSIILNKDEDTKNFLVMIEDITERKSAEDGLRQSEERYRTLAETAHDIIIINNQHGDLEYVNQSAAAIFGMTQGDLSGKNINQLFPPGVASRQLENIQKVFKSRAPLYVEAETPVAGHELWLGTWLVPLKDETGGIKSVLCVSRDLTGIKQAEKSLRASETRYRSLFEDSPISLWEEDFSAVKKQIEKLRRQGVEDFRDYFKSHPQVVLDCVKKIKVLDVNKATLGLLCAENKAQLIGNLKQVMRLESGDDFVGELVNIAEGKTEFEWEGINRTLDGKPLTVSLRWSAAPGCEETLEKVMVSMIDVTGRRGVEKALALRTDELRLGNEELTRLNDQAERRMQRLVSMRTIDMAISGSFDVNVVLGIVLDQVTGQLGSHAADILLFNQNAQTFKFCTGRGFRTQGLEHSNYKFGADLAWRVIRERRRVEISDLKVQPNVLQRSPDLYGEGFLSYIGVPLVAKGQIRGILEVFHREALYPDREWYNYLETLAGQAAIAVDNAALFERMQNSNTELVMAYDSTLVGWANALELRQLEPEGHTRRVDNLSSQMAQALGLKENDLVNIHRGTILHDIGKLGVPDSIQLKPGPLTEEEWVVMRRHPQFAYDMLSSIAYLRPALEIPFSHHERWNGTGYPRGTKGEAIPLSARLFAVVDVFDALTSDRPYRKAWTKTKALDYIRQQSGLEFDPDMAQIFLERVINKRNGV